MNYLFLAYFVLLIWRHCSRERAESDIPKNSLLVDLSMLELVGEEQEKLEQAPRLGAGGYASGTANVVLSAGQGAVNSGDEGVGSMAMEQPAAAEDVPNEALLEAEGQQDPAVDSLAPVVTKKSKGKNRSRRRKNNK